MDERFSTSVVTSKRDPNYTDRYNPKHARRK
jgi:hypothetical protein